MTRPKRLPAGIWMLGLVSLFMDISSEMIHGLLPVFLVTIAGASALVVGLIEGASEAAASFMKLVSGAWSDRMGRRKPLAVAGYALSALSKPLFPYADTAATVLGARLLDRTGKGIRGAPRDALIADLTDPAQRGAAYGLRQSLDTVGAFTGPLIAMGLMVLLAGDIRAVFGWAIVPAVIAVLILVLFVREPPRSAAGRGAAPVRIERALLRRLPPAFWALMALSVPFTLARFSEAFLILRTQSLGLALALAPMGLVVMNVAYTLSAYPAGRLSDRMPRLQLLGLGCVVLIVANGLLAAGDSLAWTWAGILLWGLHMGLTEGLIAAMVADGAPAELRGTAFGVMHFIRGLMLLAASALAGGLWTLAGPAWTFGAGAALAGLTLAAIPLLHRRIQP